MLEPPTQFFFGTLNFFFLQKKIDPPGKFWDPLQKKLYAKKKPKNSLFHTLAIFDRPSCNKLSNSVF